MKAWLAVSPSRPSAPGSAYTSSRELAPTTSRRYDDSEEGTMATSLRDLDPVWRAWLGEWADQFDGDLPVVFYAEDGTGSPDEWADGPHLAVTCDWQDTSDSGPRALVWPVGVTG